MYKARGDNRTHCKCKLKVHQKIDSSIMYEKEINYYYYYYKYITRF